MTLAPNASFASRRDVGVLGGFLRPDALLPPLTVPVDDSHHFPFFSRI